MLGILPRYANAYIRQMYEYYAVRMGAPAPLEFGSFFPSIIERSTAILETSNFQSTC
jgi:hypothetical protein